MIVSHFWIWCFLPPVNTLCEEEELEAEEEHEGEV